MDAILQEFRKTDFAQKAIYCTIPGAVLQGAIRRTLQDLRAHINFVELLRLSEHKPPPNSPQRRFQIFCLFFYTPDQPGVFFL